MSQKITDHAQRAQTALLSQFAEAKVLRAFVAVLADEGQKLEDVVYAVLTETDLDNAIGAQLDQWGGLMLEHRGELTDDEDYRRVLKAKLAAMQSDGDAPITIWIASQLVGAAVRYRQLGRASFVLEWVVGQHTNPTRTRRILEIARPAGVDLAAVEGVSPVFRFDSGPGFDRGQLATRLV